MERFRIDMVGYQGRWAIYDKEGGDWIRRNGNIVFFASKDAAESAVRDIKRDIFANPLSAASSKRP